MDEFQRETLYIPLGLKTQSELFDGFGKSELVTAIIVTLVGCVLDVLLWFMLKNPAVCVVFILTVIAGSVMMLTKDKTNISVVDQIKFMVYFARSQKVYPYRYYKEWNDQY